MRAALFAALALSLAAAACTSSEVDTLGAGVKVPELVELGEVAIGLPKTVQVPITNLSSQTVQILGAIGGEGFSSDRYVFSVGSVPSFIAPSVTQHLRVGFEAIEAVDTVESSIRLMTQYGEAVIRVSGRGVTAASVEPRELAFGTVVRGSQKELEVTVTSYIPTALTLAASIEDARGEGEFAVSSQPIPLTNGTAKIRVAYAPSAATSGPDSARLLIKYCPAHPLCEMRVDLSGSGIDGALACEPIAVDFGGARPGDLVERTVVCTAHPGAPVNVDDLNIFPAGRGFSGNPSISLPQTISGGETFELRFAASPPPNTEGTELFASARLGYSSGGVRQTIEIPLAIQSGTEELNIWPAELDFGRVALGTSDRKTMLIGNVGTRAVELSATALEPDFNVLFAGQVLLGTGESRVIDVEFLPLTVGPITGELVINFGSDRVHRVPLRGEGIDVGPCAYELLPADLDFGLVAIDRTVQRELVVANVGTADCLLHDVRILPGTSEVFSLSGAPGGEVRIAPGSSVSIFVSFTPRIDREETGSLAFYISAPSNSIPELPIRGLGSPAGVFAAPAAIDFGRVELGCGQVTRQARIGNGSSAYFVFGRVELVQNGMSFELVQETLPEPMAVVGHKESLLLGIRFHPQSPGKHVALLRVFELNRSEPYIVALSAEVVTNGVNEERIEIPTEPAVDVLFVVDNSCSMHDEQVNLAYAFGSLQFSAQTVNAVYRLAVITTDHTPPGGVCPEVADRPAVLDQGMCGYFADGDMQMQNSAWRVVTRDEQPSPSEIFGTLVLLGTFGAGAQQGLDNAHRAFTPLLLSGWNSGFRRPEADLAIVFVADADDDSTAEVDYFYDYFAAIPGHHRRNQLTVAAITGDVPLGCMSAAAGDRYVALAEKSGGIFESICGPDLQGQMETIGRMIFGARSNIVLDRDPEVSSLEVFVDGVEIEPTSPGGLSLWSYDFATRTVRFTPAATPGPGSEIIVRYAGVCT